MTVIPDSYSDLNGHMNVRYYLDVQEEAAYAFFTSLGFGEAYTKRERCGFFDVEQHLRYHAEVMVGDTVSVHPRLLARSRSAIHYISYLVNLERERIANSFEVVMIHVDLDTRRPAPLDGAPADALDRRMELDRGLPWLPATCGGMSIR